MNFLADVNVWIALAVMGHVRHDPARKWFEDIGIGEVSFCRITQQGFLRLLTNQHVMKQNALSAARAWQVYDELRTDSRIHFAPEPRGLDVLRRSATRVHHSGANFWTNAYLSAFAESAGYTLVTFNRGFRRFAGVRVHLLT